jgi:hypothetical protein
MAYNGFEILSQPREVMLQLRQSPRSGEGGSGGGGGGGGGGLSSATLPVIVNSIGGTPLISFVGTSVGLSERSRLDRRWICLHGNNAFSTMEDSN